ncbi:hypothetical protein EVAR_42797_1 [Eumeta japonica]|uniref:Uncharacterized protein n=1 Tax=Eumeta variegata TaxID=151549 RepID=A0A4C1WKR5_EUMVA|nr:hypothetical protein EVAR_42797_1 [Eumeta japonica]
MLDPLLEVVNLHIGKGETVSSVVADKFTTRHTEFGGEDKRGLEKFFRIAFDVCEEAVDSEHAERRCINLIMDVDTKKVLGFERSTTGAASPAAPGGREFNRHGRKLNPHREAPSTFGPPLRISTPLRFLHQQSQPESFNRVMSYLLLEYVFNFNEVSKNLLPVIGGIPDELGQRGLQENKEIPLSDKLSGENQFIEWPHSALAAKAAAPCLRPAPRARLEAPVFLND